MQQGGDFVRGGVFVERLQVEFANGGGDAHVFEMGAGSFFGFYDKVGEMGDLGLLVGQQAGGVGCAEGGGDKVECRHGGDGGWGFSYAELRFRLPCCGNTLRYGDELSPLH